MGRLLPVEGKFGASMGSKTIYDANAFDRPGTAMLFALTIVEVISGTEKRTEVAGPMVVAETL